MCDRCDEIEIQLLQELRDARKALDTIGQRLRLLEQRDAVVIDKIVTRFVQNNRQLFSEETEMPQITLKSQA